MGLFDNIRKKMTDYFISNADERDIRIEAARRSGSSLSGGLKLEGRSMINQSFQEWKNAVEYASDRERPERQSLTEVYDSIRRDMHLMGVVDTRILACQLSKFIIKDKDGNPSELNTLFNASWFREFVKIAMMSLFEGTKVIEVFHVNEEGVISEINEIPTSHIIHHKGIVVKQVGDEKGIPYKEGMYKNYIIQIGKDFDLGIFSELAPVALAKKIANGGWLSYIDKFAIPPVTVTTDDRTLTRQQQLLDMLKNLISSHYGVLQGNEKMEVLDVKQSDAYNVFDKFIARCNSEMSKRITGATGTTDEKSHVGAAQVHADIANMRHTADKLFIAEIVNEELIPRLVNLSPVYAALDGMTFEYDNSDELSMRETIEAITQLGNIYDMDLEVVAKKTGLPITGLREMVDGTESKGMKPSRKKKVDALAFPEISAHYDGCGCEGKDDFGMNALDVSKWTSTIDKIARDIHSGKLKPNELNADLIRKTSEELTAAQGAGWKKSIDKIDYTSTDWETNRRLRANLYKFSGAKTWQQLEDMHSMLYDADGKIRSFGDFKKDVLKIHQTYNANHLDAEYSTAVKSAQHARSWKNYENETDIYPNLRYLTTGDDRVRDAHAALDDIVRPVNDPFWDSYFPPNGYRCRCYTEQTDDKVTGEVGDDLEVKPSFLNNVGKSDRIFGANHPYFSIPKEDRQSVMKAFAKMMDADDFYLKVKTYKNGGKLDVHPLNNEPENVAVGRLLALKGYKVKLRPNIKNAGKQPDLWLDGELAEFKRPEGIKGIGKAISKANKQNCKGVVILIDENTDNANSVFRKINGELKNPKSKENIEYVMLVYKNGVSQKITRALIEEGKLENIVINFLK